MVANKGEIWDRCEQVGWAKGGLDYNLFRAVVLLCISRLITLNNHFFCLLYLNMSKK